MLNARELPVSPLQEQGYARAILNIRRVHLGTQHQAPTIDQDVALAAIDAFRAVVATNSADASCPDGLAIDNASARLRTAPDRRAELFAQDGVQVLPGAVQTPEPEIVIGGLPGCELMWQQSPSTATPYDIEDGVQDLADRAKAGSTDALGWRQKRFQASEFGVRQIGQIPAILPVKPTLFPVFRQFLVGHAAINW